MPDDTQRSLVEIARERSATQQPGTVARQAIHAQEIAEWIIGRELLWLALLFPFFLFPDRRWVLALAGLPALWIARRVARGRFLPRTPLDWPIAVMALMVFVSLFATFSIDYSLGKVTGLLFGIALYYALVEWASTGARLKRVVWGLLVGGMALSVLGLLGTNWMTKLNALADVANGLPQVVRGLPGAESGFHPNEVGGALLWVVLPAAALTIWAWSSRPIAASRVRLVLSFIFLLGLSTMVLTQSRGALTGAFVGLVLLLYLLLPRLRLWLTGLLLVAMAVLLFGGFANFMLGLLEPSFPGYPTSDPAHMGARFAIWSSALSAIRDAPLTGIGMNTFGRIMPERYPSVLVPPDFNVVHAHNIFLQTALDLGLPGMLAYTALWLISAVLLARAWRSAPDGWTRSVAAGVGAGLLSFLIFGTTDAIALGAKPGVFFWASLALVVLTYRLGRPSAQALTADD